jgi:hypothetical protein
MADVSSIITQLKANVIALLNNYRVWTLHLGRLLVSTTGIRVGKRRRMRAAARAKMRNLLKPLKYCGLGGLDSIGQSF